MAPRPGFKATVYVSASGPTTPLTNEAMTDVGGLHTTYAITNIAHSYLDPATPVVVQTSPDGTTWTTQTSGFTLNYCGGVVVFNVAVTGATPSCRISSANYITVSQALWATSVDMQTQIDIADISTLGGGAWKQKLAIIGDATIKLTQWWVDTFYISSLGSLLVVVIYTGSTTSPNQRFQCYALIKQDNLKFDVKAVEEEAIDLESSGPVTALLS